MDLDRRWDLWRKQIAFTHPDRTALRATLLAIAREMRLLVGNVTALDLEWRAVGVHVQRANLGASGGCIEREGRRVAFVAANEPLARQRFTAAHEVGHLLLGKAGSAELSRDAEERLCDAFASEYLIGMRRLATVLDEQGVPSTPQALLRLCGRFRVNVQPMLNALRVPLADQGLLLIAARRRGHPMRPWEIDFRVDGTAGHDRIFVPRHQRLRSMGFHQLADWADEARSGDTRDDADVIALLPRRAASPVAKGEVGWQARVQGSESRYVICVIDVTDLVSERQVPMGLVA